MEGRNGESREMSMTLQQEGNQVTGSVDGRQGANPITEGKIEGDELTLKVTRETERGTFTINYLGKVTGDAIAGESQMKFGDREFTRDWNPKRAAADPIGTWQWRMERQDGEPWEATLKILKSGEQLAGTIGNDTAGFEVALQKVKIQGNKLTFETVFERDGDSMIIANEALLIGNTMKGKSSRVGESGAEGRAWTATRK